MLIYNYDITKDNAPSSGALGYWNKFDGLTGRPSGQDFDGTSVIT
jgi:hypothetical protein